MGRHLKRSILYSLALLFSLTILSPKAPAQSTQINGTVVGIGGRLSGTTRPFRLIVNQLTPPAAVSELNQAIGSGGQYYLYMALGMKELSQALREVYDKLERIEKKLSLGA